MEKIKPVGLFVGIILISIGQGVCQNALQFTAVSQTDEHAIRLNWTSTNGEVYQIQCAGALATNADGSTAWQILYDEYPSQGTNTFWLDTGDYIDVPSILHPKYAPMRFYRIVDEGPDTLISDEPTVSIVSPTNGTAASGELTVTVTAGTDQATLSTMLYVDGEEMPTADVSTNFVIGSSNYVTDTYTINTCEWPNGTHTLFATARCTSAPEGPHNVSADLIGHAVSAFVPTVFSNLVTRISFTQPFFDPAAGQTQQVSAVFAANVNWTLQITDISSNTVRTATGSGTSMQFNWDGNGNGGTNLPAGVYYYYISAQTNGLAPQGLSGGSSSLTSAITIRFGSGQSIELWAMPKGGSGDAAPLALYPPGMDTNNLTIFEAPMTWGQTQSTTVSGVESAVAMDSGSDAPAASPATASAQSTPSAPQRPPNNPVRGVSGTFGLAYQTYSANGSSGYTPAFPDDGLGIGEKVEMEGYGASQPINYTPLKEFKPEANNFVKAMKKGGWNSSFIKANDQLNISDLRGSGTPFNQAGLGMLMLHGTYGSTLDYTANGCQQMYFPVAAGTGSQYLRMSEMDFGNFGTNGLKWMTIFACFSLQPDNWQNMQDSGIQPYNGDLHLLLGTATLIYTDSHILQKWAQYMTVGKIKNNPMTIRAAWYQAARDAYRGEGYSSAITFAVAGDGSCQDDMLQNNSTPTGSPYYDSNQVYP